MTKTVTWLEMTSPDDLVPGRPSPVPLDVVETDDRRLLPEVLHGVGQPHGWSSSRCSDDDWDEWAAVPDVRRWVR